MALPRNSLSVLAASICLTFLAGCNWNKRCEHGCSDHTHKTVLHNTDDLTAQRTSGPHVEEVEVNWDAHDQEISEK